MQLQKDHSSFSFICKVFFLKGTKAKCSDLFKLAGRYMSVINILCNFPIFLQLDNLKNSKRKENTNSVNGIMSPS